MNWVEEFQRLDPRAPGQWPWPFKVSAFLGIFLGTLFLAYFIFFQSQLEEIDKAAKETDQLKQTFLDKKKLAINLSAYKAQQVEIQEAFGALLKQLPVKSEMDALLIDINQAGLGRGLQFELFKPNTTENLTEFYAELPVSLKVTGGYHDLGAFTSDIAKLPRIVLLNDLDIQSTKEGTLTMEAVAKTYRYLDEEEIATQKKAAKEKEDKEKSKAPAKPAKAPGGKS